MTNTHWRLALVLGVALASACGESSEAAPAPLIRLAANPWSGSQVDAAVAKILLEEQLGFRVEIVQIDENTQWYPQRAHRAGGQQAPVRRQPGRPSARPRRDA